MLSLKKSFTEQPARPELAQAQAQAQELAQAQAQEECAQDEREDREELELLWERPVDECRTGTFTTWTIM